MEYLTHVSIFSPSLAQNNFTELWALLQFLMSGANLANLNEFGDWFSSENLHSHPLWVFSHSFPDPLEKAIEM
jgi:hypothetical protein